MFRYIKTVLHTIGLPEWFIVDGKKMRVGTIGRVPVAPQLLMEPLEDGRRIANVDELQSFIIKHNLIYFDGIHATSKNMTDSVLGPVCSFYVAKGQKIEKVQSPFLAGMKPGTFVLWVNET